MWWIYALIAGIATALGSLISKKSVSYVKDPLMRSFYFSFIGFIILTPFFLYEFSLPKDLTSVYIIIIASIIIVLGNYFIFKSFIHLNPSSINVLHKTKLVWIVILGIIFLKQNITFQDVIGMILIAVASLIIIDYKNWKVDYQGIWAVLISAFAFSLFAFCISILSKTIKPFSLLFFMTIIPTIINFVIIKDFKKKISKTYKKTKILILGAILGGIYNLGMIIAVKDEPTKTFFITEAGIIIILIGEYFWMNDKKNMLLKILAITLAIIGVLLIK